jgi:hypothetical protein
MTPVMRALIPARELLCRENSDRVSYACLKVESKQSSPTGEKVDLLQHVIGHSVRIVDSTTLG